MKIIQVSECNRKRIARTKIQYLTLQTHKNNKNENIKLISLNNCESDDGDDDNISKVDDD